jgi:hypothetical protein
MFHHTKVFILETNDFVSSMEMPLLISTTTMFFVTQDVIISKKLLVN